MRTFLAALVLLTATAWTREPRGLGTVEDRSLTREQVEHDAGAYLPAIRACYLQHAQGTVGTRGELVLHLYILNSGRVTEVTIEAPGVIGKRLEALTTCIRAEVETWQFPMRRNDTRAVIPYNFHYVVVPGGGPQYSCWDPRGCPPPRPARPKRI